MATLTLRQIKGSPLTHAELDGNFTSLNSVKLEITDVGSLATQNANSVLITGGVINGVPIGATTPASGAFTTLTASSAVTFNSLSSSGATLTGGSINGVPVGATTASTGAFTTLSASGAVSGVGFSNYLASPPAIGSTAAGSGAFTTLSASSTVSGTGFSTYLASPPAIGGTTANTGRFTTLTTTGAATLSSLSTASASLTGGSIDGTAIGATTASTGRFTTLTTTGAATLSSVSTSSATLTGGSIDAVAIGATTASTGRFSTLTTTGAATLNSLSTASATLTGGSIDSVPIGGTTPAAGSFTTVAASTSVRSTSSANPIGYNSGAGGTVTQNANKSTGVTLNRPTGSITMNAGALAASTSVTFTLTNSTITADDIVVVSIRSGATANSYMAAVTAIAAGSCSITLRNTSAGSLSEAVVLNFAVIKGAVA